MVELSIKMMRIGIEDSGEDDTVGYIKGEEEGDGQVWKEERDVKEVMMIVSKLNQTSSPPSVIEILKPSSPAIKSAPTLS